MEQLLAKTMPRDADDALGLQVSVVEVVPGRRSKAEVLSSLYSGQLIYLMKSEAAAPGLCVVSPSLLAALIEVQMSGRVSASVADERVPTPIDAIVASNMLDRWISSAKTEAGAQGVSERLFFARHFRAHFLPDARSVELVVDDGQFDVVSVSLEVSGGSKTGELTFVIPATDGRGEVPKAGTARRFRDVLMSAPSGLDAVLTRISLPLGRMHSLEVGETLEVPLAALGRVTLEGPPGNVVAVGRLGQTGGRKAVRIVRSSDERGGIYEDAGSVAFGSARSRIDVASGLSGSIGSGETTAQLPAADGLDEASLDMELPDLPEIPDLPDFPDGTD